MPLMGKNRLSPTLYIVNFHQYVPEVHDGFHLEMYI